MENKGKTFRHKVLAWLLVIAMAVSMMPVTASAATEPHTHDDKSFTPGVGQGVMHSCSCYLVHDEKVNNTTGIVVSGSAVTVDICLNGHTLDLNGTQIWINNGATVNIYDCAGGGGKITGGVGKQHGENTEGKGGAFYVRGSTLNIYGGTIEGNNAVWGGAIFIDGSNGAGISTVNMYGGTICGNTAEKGGGGIEVENGIGEKDGKPYGSYFNMYGGSIINNKVTSKDSSLSKGGGVHVVNGTSMTIESRNNSAINITGNTVAEQMNNVYLRKDDINKGVAQTITVGTLVEGSRIGVSSSYLEKLSVRESYTVTSGYGSNISSDSIKYFYMDNLHSKTQYALIHTGSELQIKKQTHEWKYEQGDSANQIRAYCVNENHTCAFKEEGTNTPILTLNADNVVYSGEQYNGISYGEEEETKWEYAGLTIPTVTYVGITAKDESYESSDTPPTDAGTYTASITVDGATATANFTIDPKPITDAVITLSPGNSVHTGSDISQTIQSVKLGDATLTESDYELDSANSVTSATNYGTYTVKINGNGNYTGSATVTWRITGGGSSSSGGSPSTPTTPTTPTENYTIPVKNENTVKVEAEIKDGTANVSEITTDMIEKVVNNKDAQSKVDTITIDLSGAKQEVTGVTLSKESVETLAKTTAEKDNGIETATIELSKATVVLDNKTLETLVDQAKGSQIELVVADTEQKKLNSAQKTSLNEYQVATTFEAYFTSDGQRIHDFNGGKAVVSIDFTPETGKDTSYYHLVYVADDGKLTRYKTKYESGRLMFTTTHFSDYAVIYDTSEKNETEEQKEDGTDTDGKVTLDTTYRKLRLRVPTTTKTTNVLKWTKVSGADGYVIYGNKCNTSGKTYKMVQQVVIKDGSTTTWVDKNLASGTYYKYYIKAYKLVDGKKVWLAKSKVVHSTTTGGKYGNAESVKVNKTAVSLAVGKTFTIKAEQIVKDLPIKKHTEIKYESNNSKVASVTSKGVIKAKKKGTCYIYVYAQNGMYKRIKVTVK